MDFSLHDFIPCYPDQNDKDIQTKLTYKKEFLEKAGPIKENVPERGDSYKHQDAFLRFAMAYDYCFVFDETGTGKSCKMLNPIRHYKKFKTSYKKCFIIEKGKSTIEEMKNQIVYKCSREDEFETDLIKMSINNRSRKKNITKEIKKWIHLETYWSFISPVYERNMTDEEITDYYSDSQFYLDEAHNLNDDTDTHEDKIKKYKTIWKIFHLAKRSKFFVFTATPAVNEVTEFASIMNLLLPLDMQMPLSWDYRKVTLKQMEPFFRGRVTFIRSLDTGAVPFFVGEKFNKIYEIEVPDENFEVEPYFVGQQQPNIPMKKISVKSDLIIYPTYMEDIQKESYRKQMITKNNEVFWFALRQISISVFPDGSYGGSFPRDKTSGKSNEITGLGKYIISPNKDEYSTKPELLKFMKNLNQLNKISCKISEMLKIEEENDYCSYVYCDFVAGGGSIFISQCFEANGYEKFSENDSLFFDNKLNTKFPKKKRYAILTHDSAESKRSSLMELWNSKENVKGEYIKVFITSPTGKEGINLSHSLRCHIINASWNSASTYQAISRILRATSYVHVIEFFKQEYLQKMNQALKIGNNKDFEKYKELSENVKIEIKIYKHVAIYQDEETIDSIDLKIYQDAEIKNIYIQRLMRMAEQCSVDALLNYERNTFNNKIENSVQCRYQSCKYQLSNVINFPNENEIDYSTYDILYSDKEVNEIVNNISNILIEKSFLTLKEIVDAGKYRVKMIYMAIDKILKDKKKIRNRYGYNSYINFNDNTLYLQKNYPSQGNNVLFNSNHLFYCEKISFKDMVKIKQEPKQNEIINKLKSIDNFDNTGQNYFNVLLSSLNINNKVQLLENAIISAIVSKDKKITLNKFDSEILGKYTVFFMKILEPWRDIEYVTNLYKTKNVNDKYSLSKMLESKIGKEEEKDKNGNKNINVFVHFLYSLTESGDYNYNVTANFFNASGKIRILVMDEISTWRDATKYEEPVYRQILQQKNENYYQPFTKYEVYGILLHGDKFSLYDKTLDHTAEHQENNLSLKQKGKICKSWGKDKLINILYREGIYPDEIKNIDTTNISEENMINYLIEKKYSKDKKMMQKLSYENIKYLYKWYISNISNTNICNFLQNYLDENGKLLKV